MTTLVHGITAGRGAYLGLFLVTMAIGGLVVFLLWEGRRAARDGVIQHLMAAFFAFWASRIVMLPPEVAGPSIAKLILFSLLNLVGYGLMAVAFMRFTEPSGRNLEERDAQGAPADGPLTTKKLVQQSSICGLIGAVFFIFAAPEARPTFGWVLLNMVFVGATARLVGLSFVIVSRMSSSHRFGILASLGTITLSWLLAVLSAFLSAGAATQLLAFTRILDIIGLLTISGTLASHYVKQSLRYMREAESSRAETRTAKVELSKLSKIATNMYEDSSDLLKKQKDQTIFFMKKVESLEQMLQASIAMQERQNLDGLLQMLVELIRDRLGFGTVTLRLFNGKAQCFETCAHVGLGDEVRDTVVNYRIPISEYHKMIEPRFRVSKSYFIRNSAPWYGEDLATEQSMLVEDTWEDIDMLIVPLINKEGATIGYFSAENPHDPKLSVPDVIENLENIALLAVVAIRNASVLKELKGTNKKLKSYAEKLSGLNELKSNFVASISHEFRTPLTSIKAYCETLLKNADQVDRDLLKQFLVVIDDESTRLMTLIDDILDFSQMESGAGKHQRAPCNLSSIVHIASQEISKSTASRRQKLHRDLPDNDVLINGDDELIKQLLIGLLHNASKFTKEEGNIWLRIWEERSVIRIIIEDDGIGIPDNQLDKIFEMFYQVDSSATREHGGSGLGLTICKNIVDWHDGAIWVENIPGSGARFVVVLPKKEAVVKSRILGTGNAIRRVEVDRFMEVLVESIAELLDVRTVSIMLCDQERGELHIGAALGLDEEIVDKARIALGDGIAGKVAAERRTLLVENIEEDSRVARSNNEPFYRSKSFLSVPIVFDGTVLGVVNVATPISKQSLDRNDQRLLEMFADRFAIAIRKLKSFAETSMEYELVRDTFKAILEAKRYNELSNGEYVEAAVSMTAEAFGLNDREVSRLRYLMSVYDLGLSRVGNHITKKPTGLSPRDREEIERHPTFGRDLLLAIETSPEVGNVVLHHHENFDGTGYPDRLQGEEIPIEARIIRVADSFRALVSPRPYQRRYSLEEAKDVLRHRAGSYFDPKVVEAFLEATSKLDEQRSTGKKRGTNETDRTAAQRTVPQEGE